MIVDRIAVKDIQPGIHYLYNPAGYCNRAKYVEVTGMEPAATEGYLEIQTAIYKIVLHRHEQIAVFRHK